MLYGVLWDVNVLICIRMNNIDNGLGVIGLEMLVKIRWIIDTL